jgi:glycosyltransferase involved in cell wall biosynthesis
MRRLSPRPRRTHLAATRRRHDPPAHRNDIACEPPRVSSQGAVWGPLRAPPRLVAMAAAHSDSLRPIADSRHQPLRIAHVTNEPFGVAGANGVQQVVFCLAHAQVALGHSVAVFSREAGVRVLSGGREVNSAARRPRDARRQWLRHRLLSGHIKHNLAEHLLSWQPDIVHFHSVHVPQNVVIAARLRDAGIPYCVTVHGALFPAALQRARIKKTLFNLLVERRYLNEAAFIHAVSPGETEAIRRHGVNPPIVVVPNALPADVDVPPSNPDALYAVWPSLRNRRIFMFVGRLDAWQKGLDVLIDAFARADLETAALVLVGPDCRGSRRQLTLRAERLGIGSRAVFMDAAFGEDRANLLAAADVFVHPSRWEGLSLSVLTAAAAGKPCLITREADPLGALERAGAAIVVTATAASVADGLKCAAAMSAEALMAMGARARQARASSSTWASNAATLGEAYLQTTSLSQS